MTTPLTQYDEWMAGGKELLKTELPSIIQKTEEFARLCAEKGKPKEFDDHLSIYTIPIRSWFTTLATKIRAHMHVDLVPTVLKRITSIHENESRELKQALEEQNARLTSLKMQSIPPPKNQSIMKLLLIAHLFVALTEAVTIATAFQLFGGSVLVSIVMFISLFAFFYFLPFVLRMIVLRFESRRTQILVGTSLALLISGLFWFLGNLRATYISALGNTGTQALSAFGFVIFNWMFLCLSLYLVFRRQRASQFESQEQESKKHYQERAHVEQEVIALRVRHDALGASLKEQEQKAHELLATHQSIEHILQAEFIEAVERFKSLIITIRGDCVPDCFRSKTGPLELPQTRIDSLPTIR